MANLEDTIRSILKCECGRIRHCDRCPYVTRSRFFHQFPSFSCQTNSLGKYNCKNCDFGSDLVIILKQHIREYHKKKIDEPKNDVEVKSYICRECSFETYSALVWIKHLDTLCFKTKEDFEKVMYGKDAKLHLSRQDVQRFRCDKCDFGAKYRYKLKHHKLIKHTSDKEALWLRCEQCSYRTKVKDYLARHRMTRHKSDEEVNWFYCFNCEYRTRRKTNLRRHMLVKHPTPKALHWFACDKCQYQTKNKNALNRHTELHNPLKMKRKNEWLKCDKCDKTIRKDTLKCHVNMHKPDEEAEWFYCHNCKFRTKSKPSLKNHKRLRHTAPEAV